MRRFVLIAWGCLLFFGPLQSGAQGNDRFAEIGNKPPATRTHLLESKIPAALPAINLPSEMGRTKGFAPMNRLDTEEELKKEVLKLRKLFVPFLQNLAPQLTPRREAMSIKKFNWRVETVEDRRHFPSVSKGEGKWKEVTVPHYGPPLGKAATYYQTHFEPGNSMLSKGALFISFRAVDYKAHVFINGSYVGSHEGAFAPFEFEITPFIKSGRNELLVKVENDYPMGGHVGDDGRKLDGDKVYAATGPGYDDPLLGWHHGPPGMGIWQNVQLEGRSTVHVNDIFIRPLGNSDTAEVWIEVNNTEASYRNIRIRHSLYGQNFKETVYQNELYLPQTIQVPGIGDLVKPTDWLRKDLAMGKGVNFLKFRIAIPNCRRWNPDQPWLYQLQIELLDEKELLLDTRKQQFGMRSFRMDTTSTPKGAMYLNEAFIRLRGANTMGSFMQDVMKGNYEQLVDDILLAKVARMNYIRMTQFPVQAEVYDYCDKLGMMTQTDLPVFGVLRRNKWAECIRQAEEMERLVRSHPGNIMVTYINERFPNAEGSPQRHLATYEEYEGFFRAADEAVHLANPDRVIKPGDGDYDPPSPGLPDNHCYNGWYNGHGLGLGEMYKGYWMPVKPGWYYACGEFGSEGLDPLSTMQKYYPKEWLPASPAAEATWTPNAIAMAQTYRFHYMWMNRQHSVPGWIRESGDHQAWVTRLTTEAFRRNSQMVSFAIHLFIDAWPAGWMKSIMDVQRQPKKAFFEYAHALQPLALSLRSDRNSFFSGEPMSVEAWLVNDKNESPKGYSLRYQWEHDGGIAAGGKAPAVIPVNNSRFQGLITLAAPVVSKRTNYTLRLQLLNEKGEAIHETDFKVDVFPEPAATIEKLWIGNGEKGIANKLSKDLHATVVNTLDAADVLLIDDIRTYEKQRAVIDASIRQGKTAIFLQPPPGKWFITGDTITVSATTMGQYYFVDPVLSDPKLGSFKPKDFFFWFNEDKGLVTPLLGEMSQMKGWKPLVTTGQTGWTGTNDYAFATAEKDWGKGKVIINHVQLAGRVKYNPTAYLFLSTLIGSN